MARTHIIEVEVKLHLLFASALDVGGWSTSGSGHINPG